MNDQREIIVELFEGTMKYGAGPVVLRDIHLTLQAGSFHVVASASASGKTSLLRTIALRQPLCAGTIRLFGRKIENPAGDELIEIRRRIGLICDDLPLLDHLSGFDNVALPLRVRNVAEGEIDEPVEELLRWLGLAEAMTKPASCLSRTERQQLAAARAVVSRPELLLADEPVATLGPVEAERLLHLFEELNRNGTTILIASSDPAFASHLPRIPLKDGQIWPRPALADPPPEPTA